MLEQLSPDQKLVIVSLPYRVGVLVSKCDQSGGRAANVQELEALANILEGFTQQVFGSELLQYVMAGTMENKERWGEWAADLGAIYTDCEKAVDILHGLSDAKDVGAYRTRLMEIGETVAVAFREFEVMGFGEKLKAYLSYMSARGKARKLKQPYKSFDDFLNISMKERAVLQKIAKALGTYYI